MCDMAFKGKSFLPLILLIVQIVESTLEIYGNTLRIFMDSDCTNTHQKADSYFPILGFCRFSQYFKWSFIGSKQIKKRPDTNEDKL